jgi:HEAT repeat protein
MKKRWLILPALLLIGGPALFLAYHHFREDLLDWWEGKQYRSPLTRSYRHKIREHLYPDRGPTLLVEIDRLLGRQPRTSYSSTLKSLAPLIQLHPEKPDPELLPVLLDLLEDRDAEIRRYAVPHLTTYRESAEAAEALIRLLDDENERVRRVALLSLPLFGPLAQPARPRLEAMATVFTPAQAVHAAAALWRLDQDREIALPVLMEALQNPDPDIRALAVAALNDHGAPEALPALTKIARSDSNPGIRMSVLEAMGRLGKPAVPALTRALDDADGTIRFFAAVNLAKIGPEAWESLPALVPLLQDPDAHVRDAAALALEKIAPEGAE